MICRIIWSADMGGRDCERAVRRRREEVEQKQQIDDEGRGAYPSTYGVGFSTYRRKGRI